VVELLSSKAPDWTIKLGGWGPQERAARGVYEGSLTQHLRWRGVTSTKELRGEVGWFWLRFAPGELQQVVEAARRDELIQPMGQAVRADGSEIAKPEWALTDRGRTLKRTRALATRDIFFRLRSLLQPALSGIEKQARTVALVLAAVPGVAAALGVINVAIGAGLALVGIVSAIVFASALRGETALRHAAVRWPRLESCRPAVYRWQEKEWKIYQRPILLWAACAYLSAVAVLLGIELSVGVLFAAAVLILVLGGLVQLTCQREHWQFKGQYNRESDEVREARYERKSQSSDACDWGGYCPVARGERSTCPKFGPGGTFED
jgi:hypothetical protein